MKKISLLSSVLCILITACGSAGASLPVTPTTTSTPSPAPSSTPSPTETTTPAPAKVDFISTLGVSDEFAKILDKQGINRSFNEDGTIKSVTVGYNPDGTSIVEENVKVVAAGVNFQIDFQGNILKDANGNPISQDIHNLGYPDGLATVVDEQGKAVFWSEEERAWLRPLVIRTDNLEDPNAYRFGKTQQIESALLNPVLNKPFDQAAIDAWKALPGWAINFEFDEPTASGEAYLRPHSGQSIRWVLDANGKPVFFQTTTPDGITHEAVLIQLLNPADQSNPKPDETLFALATPGEWWQAPGQESLGANYRALFKNWYMTEEDFTKTLSPRIYLAQMGNRFANFSWGSFPPRPNLDSLFSQPGNDPGELPLFAHPINEADKAGFGKDLPVMQWNFGEAESLPSGIQKVLFALSFASK